MPLSSKQSLGIRLENRFRKEWIPCHPAENAATGAVFMMPSLHPHPGDSAPTSGTRWRCLSCSTTALTCSGVRHFPTTSRLVGILLCWPYGRRALVRGNSGSGAGQSPTPSSRSSLRHSRRSDAWPGLNWNKNHLRKETGEPAPSPTEKGNTRYLCRSEVGTGGGGGRGRGGG